MNYSLIVRGSKYLPAGHTRSNIRRSSFPYVYDVMFVKKYFDASLRCFLCFFGAGDNLTETRGSFGDEVHALFTGWQSDVDYCIRVIIALSCLSRGANNITFERFPRYLFPPGRPAKKFRGATTSLGRLLQNKQ